MLPKMRYRLALDMGTTSIGWCLIRLDKKDNPVAVIRMGVRIFSDGRNPKDGTSLAATRRVARQLRRRRDRLLKRKARMTAALIRLGFFPEDKLQRQELVKLNPYALRKKGLYEPLTGSEFGRALFHINQRRGFKSNRKTDKKDAESGIATKAIRDLHKKLKQERCQTLGEWLANRHEKQESVRARLRGNSRKDRAYDFYADRSMIEHEFDILWAKQNSLGPALYNDSARDELRDILLHQRPLKPVKPGRCTLLPDQERAPLALPSVQRFRIYQELNNLRILNEDLTEKPRLTLEERDTLATALESKKAVTFKTGIRKLLALASKTQFNLEDIKRDRLKGNVTSSVLSAKELFGPLWHEFDLATQDDVVDRLLNEVSESKLVGWLQEVTGIDAPTAERVADASLPEGYGRLSRDALARILPELRKDVIVYSEAVTRAGFDSHSELSHAGQTGEIMMALPYYGIPLRRHVAFEKDNPRNDEEFYGKIANPTVHIGLNELRKVVNALIEAYGHPREVIIEVARDLKLSRERKRDIAKDQAERQKRNKTHVTEACRVLGLNPDTVDRSKRRELSQKMQLWVELNPGNVADRKCPYTGKQISIRRLLSSEVEIEHILPYSRTLDDSLNNKTVSLRQANRDKDNKTPYEAFGDHPDYDYESIIQRAALIPRAKAKRFAPDGYESWLRNDKDFLARALNDTAYISRIAREYLSQVCPPNKVRVIPGRMTAMLRYRFGLNRLLSGSAFKNRDDHRHHALDAAVIGVTDQGLLQRFAKASATAQKKRLDRLIEEMPLPWPNYREHVKRAVDNIIVSHKPDHGYQGAMHEETAWGLFGDGEVTRRVIPKDGGPRQRMVKRQKVIRISSTRSRERHGLDEDGQPKAYKGYVSGNNYCLEIWSDDNGKWKGDVISTFRAYQVIREYGEKGGLKKLADPKLTLSGRPLIMRLMINDTVSMRVDDADKIMRVVKMNQNNGQIAFAGHYEANVDARNRDKNDPFRYTTKVPGSFQKASGRHATVTVSGKLCDPRYRSFSS